MAFHKNGDCENCNGIGYVVDDCDKNAMYDEADRMTENAGFMSMAMAVRQLYKTQKYKFHVCPECHGTGKPKAN